MRISDWSSDVCSSDLLLLFRSVGPPEPLDRAVGLPASLQQIMDTQPLVPRAEIGMVAAAGAARVREDKHALGIGLERIGLAEIGRAGSGLDDIAVDAVGTALADDTPRASRHLGDQIGPEVVENLVERGGHRRQRRQMFDRSEEHTSELQSLMRISYDVFCLKKQN